MFLLSSNYSPPCILISRAHFLLTFVCLRRRRLPERNRIIDRNQFRLSRQTGFKGSESKGYPTTMKEGEREQVGEPAGHLSFLVQRAGFHLIGRPCKQAGRKEKGPGAGAVEDLRSVCGLHFIKGISEAEISCAIPPSHSHPSILRNKNCIKSDKALIFLDGRPRNWVSLRATPWNSRRSERSKLLGAVSRPSSPPTVTTASGRPNTAAKICSRWQTWTRQEAP